MQMRLEVTGEYSATINRFANHSKINKQVQNRRNKKYLEKNKIVLIQKCNN